MIEVVIDDSGKSALVQLGPGQPVATLEWTVEPAPIGGYWFCSICQTKPGLKSLGCKHAHQLGLELPYRLALRLAATFQTPTKARLAPGQGPKPKAARSIREAGEQSLDEAMTGWLKARGIEMGKSFDRRPEVPSDRHDPVVVRREDPEALKARLSVARARKNRPSSSPFQLVAMSASNIAGSEQGAVA